MRAGAFETIVTTLRELDTKGEYKVLWKEAEKFQKTEQETEAEIQKTLDFLSEFGHLKAATDKLKKARAGKLSDDVLTRSVQQIAALSNEDLLEIYKISHSLFSEKKFDKAASVATFLSYLNPNVSAFWRMAGACHWNLASYHSALIFFLYASMINVREVANHLSTLDCFIKLGMVQDALNYYNTAKGVLSDLKQWDEIKLLDTKIASI